MLLSEALSTLAGSVGRDVLSAVREGVVNDDDDRPDGKADKARADRSDQPLDGALDRGNGVAGSHRQIVDEMADRIPSEHLEPMDDDPTPDPDLVWRVVLESEAAIRPLHHHRLANMQRLLQSAGEVA